MIVILIGVMWNVNVVLYFLYKNEYRIFRPVEITLRRELRKKGEK
jgi:hypothetical protein